MSFSNGSNSLKHIAIAKQIERYLSDGQSDSSSKDIKVEKDLSAFTWLKKF